jgi:arylsulfatase
MLFNLYTDPREETPALDSWVVGSMLNIVGEFQESVKTHPLIPMGTPDPYTPP